MSCKIPCQTDCWHVYIIKCSDETLYTGIAKDLNKRLEVHNSKKGAKYTRGRTPVRLIYAEPHPDRSSAGKREMEIKKLSRSEKLQLSLLS
jgi:putative endonuclease